MYAVYVHCTNALCLHPQACGDWDQALHVAEQSDKINLKATHCSYAQLQQANGDFETAIKHHQLADTHRLASSLHLRLGAMWHTNTIISFDKASLYSVTGLASVSCKVHALTVHQSHVSDKMYMQT